MGVRGKDFFHVIFLNVKKSLNGSKSQRKTNFVEHFGWWAARCRSHLAPLQRTVFCLGKTYIMEFSGWCHLRWGIRRGRFLEFAAGYPVFPDSADCHLPMGVSVACILLPDDFARRKNPKNFLFFCEKFRFRACKMGKDVL